jgi:ABC-2 type transport system ATP-binding protein
MHAIEVQQVSKTFDEILVLNGLDLVIPSGQMYGILGGNGSGKTTLLRLLLGFLKPNSGNIRVLGEWDLETARQRIGYLPERIQYHLNYSARDYLQFLAQFQGIPKQDLQIQVNYSLDSVGLHDAADRKLKHYSKGMLQRFGIAQALLNDPELLIVDEPSSGLDPSGQQEILDLLTDLHSQGRTILLTTHLLDEAEVLCDRIGILRQGRIIQELDREQFSIPSNHVILRVSGLSPELTLQLERLSPAVRCLGAEVHLQPNSPELQTMVLQTLLAANVSVLSLRPQKRTLDDLLQLASSRVASPVIEQTIADDDFYEPPIEEEPEFPVAPQTPTAPSETLLNSLLTDDDERWRPPRRD